MKTSHSSSARPSIFTWHVHGTYLYYLSRANIDIYIPVGMPPSEGYYGRGLTFPFGDNVKEVPASLVKEMTFDCILFQSRRNFLQDQFELLSEEQRRLPRIYLEHNTPDGDAVHTIHEMDDPAVTLVHVTHFNKLMWQHIVPDIRVVEHGVPENTLEYTGELERGVVVINHIKERGRVTGWDIFEQLRKQVPLDLAGMGTEKYGGLGEVLFPDLPAFLSRYRFFLNPIRHTSLALSLIEAMMAGLPVVSLATTEYATTIVNGYSGFVHNDTTVLLQGMKRLLNDWPLAAAMGRHAQLTAKNKFSITRFAQDWETLIHSVVLQKNEKYEKENSIHQ